jgi:hypothetical protein
LGLVFFGVECAGADSATGSMAGGVEDTNTGAGAELAPAGWRAAAAIRAARSAESRFFFMQWAYVAIARWCGITIA